jgi:hypothetical protein
VASWAHDQYRRRRGPRNVPVVRRARRSSILALLGVAAAAAVSLPLVASAGPGGVSPDLRADPPERISGPQVYFTNGLGANQLLVRFDGFVTNVGAGPLEVSGNPQNGSVYQRRWGAGEGPGTFASTPVQPARVTFETGDGHNHFHLARAMRYSLWNLERTAQVAPGQKVGFCLYDIEDAPQPSPPKDPLVYSGAVTSFCDQNNAGSTDLRMGTSSGWRDVYDQNLAFQWVDVSNTTPGTYLVGAEADPDNTIWEGGGAAEYNPPAFSSQQITVPGWTAQPVNLVQGAAQAVPLAAQKFGAQSNSNLQYQVTSAPANGTLNVAVGQVFPGTQQVVYTPNPGYAGDDRFTYVARSASSSFPINPQQATVAITDNRPSVAISGAPASLVAGTSAQLTAAVKNLPGGVTWGASAGSISPTGLYKAPGAPPKGGVAAVRATSTANPAISALVGIKISPSPKVTAKPDPFARLTAGRKLLSPVRVKVIGRRTLISKVVTGRRGGRVTLTTTFGPRVLGRCSTRVGARKGFLCKVVLKRNYPLTKVRVTAKLTVTGGKSAVRRTFAR